jgi:transcriptional regulator with GAF, ATPase, and Fis domain
MARKDDARLRRSLLELVRQLAEDPDLGKLLRVIFETACAILPVDAMYVALLRRDGRYLKLLETDLDDAGRRVFCARRPMQNTSEVLRTLDRERYVLIHRTAAELRRLGKGFADGEPWTPVGNPRRRSASLLFVPVWFGAAYAGAISVQSYRRNAYRPEDAERLILVAEYVGLALRHAGLMAGSRGRLPRMD